MTWVLFLKSRLKWSPCHVGVPSAQKVGGTQRSILEKAWSSKHTGLAAGQDLPRVRFEALGKLLNYFWDLSFLPGNAYSSGSPWGPRVVYVSSRHGAWQLALTHVHALPSLWVLRVSHNKAQPMHHPAVATATVKTVCSLSPWVLLFDYFVLAHLKTESQSGPSYKRGSRGQSLGPLLW